MRLTTFPHAILAEDAHPAEGATPERLTLVGAGYDRVERRLIALVVQPDGELALRPAWTIRVTDDRILPPG